LGFFGTFHSAKYTSGADPIADRTIDWYLLDMMVWVWVNTYRYIFSGMNIHLPAILMFTRGTRFWHTAMYFSGLALPNKLSFCVRFMVDIWGTSDLVTWALFPKVHTEKRHEASATDQWARLLLANISKT
jgi:hypothetical protein